MTAVLELQKGSFWGVGVGPGDPELMTFKSARLIREANVLSFIVSEGGNCRAKDIALQSLGPRLPSCTELPIHMPMCQDRSAARAAYDLAAEEIEAHLSSGKNVVFLCEGDPLFFGSLAHLLARLHHQHSCSVVPGVASPQAAAALLRQPLAMLTESYVVVSGRHDDDFLRQALETHDNVVIMKAGNPRQRLLSLLRDVGRERDACYLENVGQPQQRVVTNVASLTNEETSGPYFSLFLVTRRVER